MLDEAVIAGDDKVGIGLATVDLGYVGTEKDARGIAVDAAVAAYGGHDGRAVESRQLIAPHIKIESFQQQALHGLQAILHHHQAHRPQTEGLSPPPVLA